MILITGDASFIGSNFVDYWLAATSERIVNVDTLTYAGNFHNLTQAFRSDRHFLSRATYATQTPSLRLTRNGPRAIINFATESHVDRSIQGTNDFIQTNLFGTSRLLKAAFEYWTRLENLCKIRFRLVQTSTDEVYGSLDSAHPPFCETSPYARNNPNAASKAGAEHLVRSFHRTSGLPVITTSCSDNYGPQQFPEKRITSVIYHALNDWIIPIYGDGLNIRDWIYVADHCSAIGSRAGAWATG